MSDVNSGHAAWISALLGAPMRFDLSGHSEEPLAAERHVAFVELITRLTHRRGQILESGERLDWRNRSDVEALQVVAQNEEGSACVRIRADYAAMTFFAFFAILFSGMFMAAAIGGFAFKPSTIEGMALIGIVGFIASYAAARAAWSSFAAKRHRDLQRLLDVLVASIGDEG